MHPDCVMMTCKEAAWIIGKSADHVRKMLKDELLEGDKVRPMRVSVSSLCELYGLREDTVYQRLAKWRSKAVEFRGQSLSSTTDFTDLDEKELSPIARQLNREIQAKVKVRTYDNH